MPIFKLPFSLILTVVAHAALCLSDGNPLAADESCGTVSLSVSAASVKRGEADTLFQFEAVLENTTGKELTVRTNFSSVFDGLVLEVKNAKGETLVVQPYTFHQSPFAPPGRELLLKRGKTAETLVFPVRDFPKEAGEVGVFLGGLLPGHGERYVHSAKPIRLKIKK